MFDPLIGLLGSPWVLGLLGLAIGSFLNVVIHRKPRQLERDWLADAGQYLQDGESLRRTLGPGQPEARMQLLAQAGQALTDALADLPRLGLATPRSRCPSCGHAIAWHENIPVLSWLRLRGRCSACGSAIGWRYPVVELATGGLFFAAGTMAGPGPQALVLCAAIALLMAAALIDLDTTLLPDDLTLPLVALGLVAAWQHWTPVSLSDAALGLLFGYGALWAVAALYRLVRGVQGMAEGDFKLLAGLGALLGWQLLPSIILLASAVGAVVGVALMVFKGHGREQPIPFGPYLAGGGAAAIFFGPQLAGFWPWG